jgi:hypothetical protein
MQTKLDEIDTEMTKIDNKLVVFKTFKEFFDEMMA